MVGALLWMLADKREPWDVLALPSLRMRVSPARVRIPDVCVICRGGPHEQVLTRPPLAVIEVLDDEDRFSATLEKLEDFRRFGVEYIWVINPERRTVYRHSSGSLEMVRTGELAVPGTPIRVVPGELFAELDRA